MAVRAQAVIIDALLLFILCSFAATFLLWASSVYGNKALRAYTFLYEGEYETGLINALSEMKYNVSDVSRHWLDEVGYYLNGDFDETSDRYTNITKWWDVVCLQSSMPMQLDIVTLDTPQKKLTLNCSIDPTDFSKGRVNDSVYNYMIDGCDPSGQPCRPPPPYYSSGVEIKFCGGKICALEAKIYY